MGRFDLDNTFAAPEAGNDIFRSDKRQFAALLFGLSICATFFPFANLATAFGPDGREVPDPDKPVNIARIAGWFAMVATGLTGMQTAYLAIVHNYGHKLLTGALILLVQTAWIPYISDMVFIGQAAATGSAFIPPSYNPTSQDVWAVGAFGILGVFTYGACFLGSFAFMTFALYAYQAGKPGHRSATYYRGRLAGYSLLVFIAGEVQVALGALVLIRFGSGPLLPPIGVAMFTATWPEVLIASGAVYMVNGGYGVLRATLLHPNKDDNKLQYGIALQYAVTVFLLIGLPVAYLPGGAMAAAAPSRACLMLGAHVLPAFLDYKARTSPNGDDLFAAEYYGFLDTGKYSTSGSGSHTADEEEPYPPRQYYMDDENYSGEGDSLLAEADPLAPPSEQAPPSPKRWHPMLDEYQEDKPTNVLSDESSDSEATELSA